jgi:hypothetical protein
VKIRVPIAGTVGKSVQFDPDAGARAEAAVAALAAQINAGLGGSIRHSSLLGLQIGDDHPQYTGNQFPETITGQWNFQTIPFIQGETLAEYIEDVVGGSFFDFLQDTSSVVWTYHDTAQELEANVPPEFVQDTVGAMLTDSTSIDFTYNDPAGTFTAAIIDEYVQDLVGAMATDSTSIDFTYNDGAGTLTAAVIYANPTGSIGLTAVNGTAATATRSDATHALDQGIVPTWTGSHKWTTQTNTFQAPAANDLILALQADPGSNADFRFQTRAGVNRWLVRKDSDAESGSNAGSNFGWVARADDGSNLGRVLHLIRATGLIEIGFGSSSHIRGLFDNQELQLGASQDLRLYHDGTNSFIENDTGNLIIKVNGELDLEEVTTSTGTNIPTIGTNKPGSAVSLTPSTWMTVIVNGTTYYTPLWV